MFTGIIKEVGTIKSIKKTEETVTFEVETKNLLKDKKIGDSIAVNGACMTITELNKENFKFDVMQESIEKTNLGTAKESSKVNLEPALTLNQAIDGHMVQGHIDESAEVVDVIKEKNRTQLRVKYSKKISKYIAFKGSITINGVSLTISDLQEEYIAVDLIPHTLKKTNLGKLKKGDLVNLEADMIARYLERMLSEKNNEAKYEYLKERNLI